MPSDQVGKSRWLGQGQFLGFQVCQSVREILASDLADSSWSRRTVARLGEVRDEFPWIRADSTALARDAKGEVRWWTFGGGVANTILGQHLKRFGEADADNLSIRLGGDVAVDALQMYLGSLSPDEVRPTPDARAVENLKFSEALPRSLADEVFCARFNDEEAVSSVLAEPMRVVSEGEGSA